MGRIKYIILPLLIIIILLSVLLINYLFIIIIYLYIGLLYLKFFISLTVARLRAVILFIFLNLQYRPASIEKLLIYLFITFP